MRILYATYWGVNEGLSVATSQPNLRLLCAHEKVEKVDYVTIERNSKVIKPIKTAFDELKVNWKPIYSKNYKIHFLNKINDIFLIRKFLLNLVKANNYDIIIFRGAIMAMFAYWVKKHTNAKVGLESYEPHAAYMLESGVWKASSLFYKAQLYYEKLIKQSADFLTTVTENYKQYLIDNEQVKKDKINVSPCWVQLDKFRFNPTQREKLRADLGWQNATVGIYVGKFGSIYYDEEAFDLFKAAFDFFPDFRLILLSPDDANSLKMKLERVKISIEKTFIKLATHEEIPSFLSAADFAFSPIKVAPVRRFCSPIKDGEYWACGLPIIIPDGVGDDSDIIKKEGGGAVIDIHNPQSVRNGLEIIAQTIKNENYREEIRTIAVQHRDKNWQEKAYQELLKG